MIHFQKDSLEAVVMNNMSPDEKHRLGRLIDRKQVAADCERMLQEARDHAAERIEASKRAIAERRKRREAAGR